MFSLIHSFQMLPTKAALKQLMNLSATVPPQKVFAILQVCNCSSTKSVGNPSKDSFTVLLHTWVSGTAGYYRFIFEFPVTVKLLFEMQWYGVLLEKSKNWDSISELLFFRKSSSTLLDLSSCSFFPYYCFFGNHLQPSLISRLVVFFRPVYNSGSNDPGS